MGCIFESSRKNILLFLLPNWPYSRHYHDDIAADTNNGNDQVEDAENKLHMVVIDEVLTNTAIAAHLVLNHQENKLTLSVNTKTVRKMFWIAGSMGRNWLL